MSPPDICMIVRVLRTQPRRLGSYVGVGDGLPPHGEDTCCQHGGWHAGHHMEIVCAAGAGQTVRARIRKARLVAAGGFKDVHSSTDNAATYSGAAATGGRRGPSAAMCAQTGFVVLIMGIPLLYCMGLPPTLVLRQQVAQWGWCSLTSTAGVWLPRLFHGMGYCGTLFVVYMWHLQCHVGPRGCAARAWRACVPRTP